MYKIFLPNLIYISHNLFISKKINLQKNENEVTNYIDFLENSLKIKKRRLFLLRHLHKLPLSFSVDLDLSFTHFSNTVFQIYLVTVFY